MTKLEQVIEKAADIRKQAKALNAPNAGRDVRRDIVIRYLLTASMELTNLMTDIAKDENVDISPEEHRG